MNIVHGLRIHDDAPLGNTLSIQKNVCNLVAFAHLEVDKKYYQRLSGHSVGRDFVV